MLKAIGIAAVVVLCACGGDAGGDGDAGGNGDGGTAGTVCLPTDDLVCDRAGQVCVVTGPFGPTNRSSCAAVPPGCERDRSCACLEAALCPQGTFSCTDTADNTIFCDNGTQ